MDALQALAKISIPPEQRYVSVQAAEGEFMHQWVRKHGLKNTLEIGFAFGASGSCLLSAHEGRHTCIDPFQETEYASRGLENIEALGYRDRLEFHPGFSHDVLPKLLADGRKFDFVFIDGDHRYDGIFVDFYYVDLLLEDQGYVLFHDGWMRSTRMVAAFVKNNRKDYRMVRTPLRNLVLFQKVGRDQRAWTHFKEFYTWRGVLTFPAIVWMLQRGLLQKIFKG